MATLDAYTLRVGLLVPVPTFCPRMVSTRYMLDWMKPSSKRGTM